MDKNYWNNFYDSNFDHQDLLDCSTFAKFCSDRFFKCSKNIVDLGCGNARDSKYFASNHHSVYAIDQVINQKLIDNNKIPKLKLLESDFVHFEYSMFKDVDIFYSRFTIHSITQEDQSILLPKVYQKLNSGGLFCIEVRTTKDPKFGLGQHISDTTYFLDNHTRRFIDSRDFLTTLLSLGFKLRYFNEQDNLSIYKDDNPVLLRIILEK